MSTVDTDGRFWRLPDHAGVGYLDVLKELHAGLQPRRYLEIGTLDGGTLALANCPSVAIDPKFGSLGPPAYDKPATLLFQMTSDAFFASYDPTILLNGPIDMAFLDGMHLYEFLLRDFINVERSCKPNSIILLHDCIPTDAHVARRRNEDVRLEALSEHPGWWAGDVWKAALIIRRLRPDLKFFSFDAGPTGLVAITGLDPHSRVLSAAYFDAVAEYRALTLDQAGAETFLAAMNCIPFSPAIYDLANMFWL